MTSVEMQQEFLILYDKVTNFDAPGYEDLEISIFLTKGQEHVFFSVYNPLKNVVREGFEKSEARRKDLRELVEAVTLSPSATQIGTLPNGVMFDLPADCLYVIAEEITTASADLCKNNVRLRVKPTTHDQYVINKKSPFKKPTINTYAWRLDFEGGQNEIITDGTFTPSSYHVRYLKRLTPIITSAVTVDGVIGPQNCVLDQILHKRIVEEAVKIATGVTDPQFYEIKSIEQKNGET